MPPKPKPVGSSSPKPEASEPRQSKSSRDDKQSKDVETSAGTVKPAAQQQPPKPKMVSASQQTSPLREKASPKEVKTAPTESQTPQELQGQKAATVEQIPAAKRAPKTAAVYGATELENRDRVIDELRRGDTDKHITKHVHYDDLSQAELGIGDSSTRHTIMEAKAKDEARAAARRENGELDEFDFEHPANVPLPLSPTLRQHFFSDLNDLLTELQDKLASFATGLYTVGSKHGELVKFLTSILILAAVLYSLLEHPRTTLIEHHSMSTQPGRILDADFLTSLNTSVVNAGQSSRALRQYQLERSVHAAQTLAVDVVARSAAVGDHCLALKLAPVVFHPHLTAPRRYSDRSGGTLAYGHPWVARLLPTCALRLLQRGDNEQDGYGIFATATQPLASLRNLMLSVDMRLNPRDASAAAGAGLPISSARPAAFAAVDAFGATLQSLATEHAGAIRRLNLETAAAERAVTRGALTRPFTAAQERRRAARARRMRALAEFYSTTATAVEARAASLKALRTRIADGLHHNERLLNSVEMHDAVARFGRPPVITHHRGSNGALGRMAARMLFPERVVNIMNPDSGSGSGGGESDASTAGFFSASSTSSASSSSSGRTDPYVQLREIVEVSRGVSRCGDALAELAWTLDALHIVTDAVARTLRAEEELESEKAVAAAAAAAAAAAEREKVKGKGTMADGGDGGDFDDANDDDSNGGGGGGGGVLDIAASSSSPWSWALGDAPALFPLLVVEPHVSYQQAKLKAWRTGT